MLDSNTVSHTLPRSIRNMFKAIQKKREGKEHISSIKEKDLCQIEDIGLRIMTKVKDHYCSDTQDIEVADIDVSVLRLAFMDEAMQKPSMLKELKGDKWQEFIDRHAAIIIDSTKITDPEHPVEQAQRQGDALHPSDLLPEDATPSQKASMHSAVGKSLPSCYWQRHSEPREEPGLRQKNESKAKKVSIVAALPILPVTFTPVGIFILPVYITSTKEIALKCLENKAEKPLKAALYYHHKNYPELLTEDRLEELKEKDGLFHKVKSSDIMALVQSTYHKVYDDQRTPGNKKSIMLSSENLPEAVKETMATIAKDKGDVPFSYIAEFLGLQHGISARTARDSAITAYQLEQQIIGGKPEALPPGENNLASWREKILEAQQKMGGEYCFPRR